MCEIKLKEPTDGSEIQEGGEAEETVRKQPKICSITAASYSETNRTSHGPVKHRKRAAVFGEAQHSYSQSCGNHKCIQDVLGLELTPGKRFRGRLSEFRHLLKVICCFDFKACSWTRWFRHVVNGGKNASFAFCVCVAGSHPEC